MQTHSHITLSQLQRLVKETLHERFALPVWVSAEISEIKVNYSGHCYLELVEKGGDNGVPLAGFGFEVSCDAGVGRAPDHGA